MDNRTVPFIITMTLIFVGLVIVQALVFQPKIPDIANEQPSPQKTQPPDSELAADPGAAGESNSTDQTGGDAVAADAAENEQDTAAQQEAESTPQFPRQFVTIGSLDADSSARMLACFDSRGATLRRVELNARKPNGRLMYRDVQNKTSYVGELELKSVEGGCLVRVVGPGTPAARAGIEVGDVITAINGEPIVGPLDFEQTLGKFAVGTELTISISRAGDNAAAMSSVTLVTTRRPMQVIRPTPVDELRLRDLKRRGFQLTLQQQQLGAWPDLDEDMRLANWQTRVIEEGQAVEFSYEVPASEKSGRLLVIKRFRLAAPTDSGLTLDRSFHIEMEFEIRNLEQQPQTVNYELTGPTGLPVEGWWYQQKIHGGTWAIGKQAGARDIVSSTEEVPFKFTAGPQIVTDFEANDLTPIIEKVPSAAARTVRFMAVDTVYFATALLPTNGNYECFSAYAITASELDEVKRRRLKTTDVSFVIYSNPVTLPPYQEGQPDSAHLASFEIFAGPKDPNLLPLYGLSELRTFGWFAMFSKPLCWLLTVFHSATFGWSYGLAIILLTILVRSLMIPISRKAAINAQMMQHLQPEVKKIAEKYKDDMEKRAQAQRELFAKYKYNPFGGCLLMFLQLPIFIGLYRGLSVEVALRDQPFIPGLGWCSDLAGPDMLLRWEQWMPTFLADETGWLGPYFNILPIATVILFLIQQKMFMPPATDDQQKMVQRMMTLMMVFMGFIFFKVSSGLCIYFITSSIWGIIERKLLPKPQLDVSKFGDSSAKTTKKKVDAEPVSLPMRNEKELELRKRRDRERKKKLKDRK